MIKNNFTTYILLFFLILQANAQKTDLKSPSEYFPNERTKILVVGTIHLDYPNLDAAKTDKKDQIDVLEESKQKEVTELVNYIKQFKPTKVVIEAWDNFNATEKLREYKKGKFRDERSERYQLGIRIASELNLDTLYAIDANPMVEDLQELDSTYTENLFKGFDFKSDDPLWEITNEWYKTIGKLPTEMNLLSYYKYINSREHHKYEFGAYLVGDFKLENERGADILSVWWYNRNLRIFRKIQKINNGTDDRILVIYGNGHAAILRQLFDSSPEYDFIEFDSI
ncbi:DUF5694 domain-containing protein [Gillisia limnaea]|uniref:Haem-binding uptake Tiki superfamily ChaN domain-containing protein n=1 Tax=Gillisia limnaea (strain DSM 15749 / LMG 21470 / R-8282) TaxID=865937 RepID=H2BXN1_GILLR|nr:DUF5694 domain-containing protein [Gillisia limnaea]EHQ03155.1 hypothetical protein Gilli_2535 [Gillisia limnaea DSM 15749]